MGRLRKSTDVTNITETEMFLYELTYPGFSRIHPIIAEYWRRFGDGLIDLVVEIYTEQHNSYCIVVYADNTEVLTRSRPAMIMLLDEFKLMAESEAKFDEYTDAYTISYSIVL